MSEAEGQERGLYVMSSYDYWPFYEVKQPVEPGDGPCALIGDRYIALTEAEYADFREVMDRMRAWQDRLEDMPDRSADSPDKNAPYS